RFLYKLKEGPTADSFGIHVARIAGLPKPVIERAWKVLEELESNSFHDSAQASTSQLSLFDAGEPAEAASAAASSASPRKRGQRLRAREDANFA
ncbi:MutS-related protein, partial [Escherichia coli]